MVSKNSNSARSKKGKKGQKSSKPAASDTKLAVPTPTHSNSDTSLTQEQSSHLLRLPLELREKIYTHLLDARCVRRRSSVAYTPQVKAGKLHLIPSPKPFNFSLAILRTNKQIHSESLHIFHSTNLFIRLSLYNDDIYWTEALLEGSEVDFASSSPRLSTLTTQALDVEISMENSRRLRCQVVFPATYLPRFIHLLECMCTALPQWSRDHSISLFLRHSYRSGPLATETLLLEPWRALHGIHQVVVGTNITPNSFAQSLRTSMMGSKWDPWTWLESVRRQKEMGAVKMRQGMYAGKVDYFVDTIALLEKLYRGPQYPALKAAGEEFDKAVNRLRLQCELNIMLAAIKTLANFDIACDAGDRVLALVEGRPGAWTNTAPYMPRNHESWYTDLDKAKVLYRRGCMSMELFFTLGTMELLGVARAELVDAQKFNPGDERVEKALKDMERRRKTLVLEEQVSRINLSSPYQWWNDHVMAW